MSKNFIKKRVPESLYNIESPGSGLKSWNPEFVDEMNVIQIESPTDVAIDIADHLAYERGVKLYWRKMIHYYSKKRGIVLPINDDEKFLRKHVKKKLSKHLNDSVVAEFRRLIKEDVEGKWRIKLEKRDRSIVLLKSCWFDVAKCYRETLGWGVVPGFQRWKLDIEMHEKPERPKEIDETKLTIGEVVSGYVLNAPVKWCNDIKTGEIIKDIIKTAYPYTGPVAYLNACSDTMADFTKVVADDVVAVMVKGIMLDTWTSAVRERLDLLVKAKIPTVICADFQPIKPIGDETDCISKDITVVKHMDMPANVEQFISDGLYSLAWASQMHFKHQEVDAGVFGRTNPNDIPAMLSQFIKVRMRLTKQENDVIFLQDILCKFQQYVNEAGGRGDNISIKSLGIQIKKVIETRVENRYDKSKRKTRSALIGYVWIE